MGKDSHIQWTDHTWNIARGCTKVDEDCRACYMYRDSLNGTRYNPYVVTRTKTVFNLPLKISKPSRIFTSSLTDWAHPAIDSFRHEVWDIVRACPHHDFQMLTKLTERLPDTLPRDWGMGYKNVWLGTSVGSEKSLHRIDELCAVPAEVLFVSIEPLWGPVELPIDWADGSCCVNWVIVGGESGHDSGKYRYRECKLEWIEKIVQDCERVGIPVFVKQLGTHLAKKLGLKDRHGGDVSEWPFHLRRRQFPMVRRSVST